MSRLAARVPFPKAHSIRARMTLAFTLFIALLMTLMGLAFFLYLEHQEQKRVDVTLTQALGELREELDNDGSPLQNITELVNQESGDLRALNVALAIVDSRGRIIARSQSDLQNWPLSQAWRGSSLQYRGYTVVVALPWNRIQGRLLERTRTLLLMGGMVVLLSSVGAWYLVGRTLSPLDGLARQASAASTKSLSVQLETPSSDAEMLGLVFTLNDLLHRVSQTAQLQGRFYASASHELRTPLQVLNLLHEMTLSQPREAAEYATAMTQSHDQIQRLTRLVQDLLLLNQLDMNSSRPEPVLVDLADICEGELSHLQFLIRQKSLKIACSLPPRCDMTAPWTHITMLLRNLTENAVKYARDEGGIEVEVSADRVRIWNECESAPDFQAEKYYEPFFRPDASRNSQTGGNGLGLSICKAICETNGWHMALTTENGGVSAVVDFG